jgi:asparagine synthase (glutamine-hydrolysing)
MRDVLHHRGPDDSGLYLGPGVALGSRRLSILDLSPRGHMPMSTPEGRYSIVYNGEAYNFRGLRPALEKAGYAFQSDGDTEVVLALYATEGPAMLERLNGMFAFAIWDAQDRTLFLARDRLGIKPLYYAYHDGGLYFASEEKALFAAGVPRSFDGDTWEELLCFRYVAGERTPYVGVKRLLPGHWMQWQAGEAKTHRWWDLSQRARALRDHVPADPVGWFRETFDDSVSLRRISDVPVGVLLSGGLDSSSVGASLGSQGAEGLASFTVRFDEPGFDEWPLARELAERWQLTPHEVTHSLETLLPQLRRATWFNDEPLAHVNYGHLLLISEYAKQWVTVLLSGEAADEVMGGYVRYRPLAYPGLLRAMKPVLPLVASALGLKGRWQKLARFLSTDSIDQFVMMNSCDTLPGDLEALGMNPTRRYPFRERILEEAKHLYPGEPQRQAMYSDQHGFLCSLLDRNDRMTMGASIECRVPFLDYRLVEGLASLSSSALQCRRGKQLMRQAVGDRLPKSILQHRKWGFGVPWSHYLRTRSDLKELVEELPNLQPVCAGPFERNKLQAVLRSFLHGDDSHGALVLQLVLIAIWHDVCI